MAMSSISLPPDAPYYVLIKSADKRIREVGLASGVRGMATLPLLIGEQIVHHGSMPLSVARQINADLVRVFFFSEGLRDHCPDLSRYTLSQMVEATEIMAMQPPLPDGAIEACCDPRFVAAAFTAANWHTTPASDPEPILQLPGRFLCLIGSEPNSPERRCRVCGCTDDRACEEGCSWVEADLCSRCVGK
jgi:hypothetical protein